MRADMVTYGKTVGRRPADRRSVRQHAIHAALSRRPAGGHLFRARHLQFPSLRHGRHVRVPAASRWRRRSSALRRTSSAVERARTGASTSGCARRGLPLQVANLSSIWTICYTRPSRYNWMLQYYLRAAGLALTWVGTGRLIFSLNYTDEEFAEVAEKSWRRPGDAGGRLVVDAAPDGFVWSIRAASTTSRPASSRGPPTRNGRRPRRNPRRCNSG